MEKNEETANNLFDESTKKYFEKKFPRALELIDDAIRYDPSNNLLYCFKVSIMLEQIFELKEKSPNNWKTSSDKILKHALETIDDAISKVKRNCTAKFNESIDVSFKLNLIIIDYIYLKILIFIP